MTKRKQVFALTITLFILLAWPLNGSGQERRAKLRISNAGFTITAVHLDVSVRIPGGDQAKFDQAAQNAEKGCPVSRVLKADITMDAKLLA